MFVATVIQNEVYLTNKFLKIRTAQRRHVLVCLEVCRQQHYLGSYVISHIKMIIITILLLNVFQ